MSSADVLDRPEVVDRTSDEKPPMFHYVRKTSILSSVVDGGMVEALCGEVFEVRRTPKPGAPVCPECEEVFRGMKP